MSGLTFADAGVAAAQAVSLLTVTVEPDAEDHEDDPAGCADACDEGRLADHVRDLLRNRVLIIQRRRENTTRRV